MEQKKDLFNIRLTEEGVQLIPRIYRVVVFCFCMGVLVNLAMVIAPVRYLIRHWDALQNAGSYFTIRIIVLLAYYLLASILYSLQFWYFFRFAKKVKAAIRLNDSFTFNQSLSYMYKAFWMTATGTVLNGIYAFYSLFGSHIF